MSKSSSRTRTSRTSTPIAVGWTKRYVESGGERYYWEEHLFFSPFHGYRFLVYQNGHFSLVTPVPGAPEQAAGLAGGVANYEGTAYRHFQQGES